ncbi:TlpA disulfide reductase family protein [Mycolicibacillus trivialis]|uniref:Thioredoxin domain-containing protein n=1 Tax=Mycolicibacillus trivialis TaxID=1798 RepID=A0A1X2EIE5_9MYCO|nr:TlpA disulfide reductase family protein [Mycolicibacillus trivialis]ORX02829.1 hypothetical protein AWC30_12245 [Mycolicibacillus trivialis]
MNRSLRWTIAGLVVVVALIVALALELRDRTPSDTASGPGPTGIARDHRAADTPEALAQPRRRADLLACPTGDGGTGAAALRDIVVECAGDGSPVAVGPALSGTVTVLNLWAYWCGPCAVELPALAEYQRRAGPRVSVVTVHQDENEAAALARLAELGVKLPTLQDGRRRIAAALRVPNVMPATVVLNPDGSVAQILPRPFESADDIAAAVGDPM